MAPGYEDLSETACLINEGLMDYCLHSKRNEDIPLTNLSEGYISELLNGRVYIKLVNYTSEVVRHSAGAVICFIKVNIYSLNWNKCICEIKCFNMPCEN